MSCSPELTPEETARLILDYTAADDREGLARHAPFLSELEGEERKRVNEAWEPYLSADPAMESRRLGFSRAAVTLTSKEREARTLVMNFTKEKGRWILSPQVSYTQRITFIPGE